MKKNLLFFVAAVGMLALASCSQDTMEMSDNTSVIKFRPSINGMTRASLITTNNISSFNVTAFIDGHGENNYFTNLQMNKSGDTWTSSRKEYWPPTKKLNFFAYAPTSNIGIVSITPNEQTIKGFEVADKEDDQHELIVAYNAGTKADNENSGVALNFKHALARVDIQAKNARPNDYEIEVLGVKLVGFKSKADLTFPKMNGSGTIPSENWKNKTLEKSYYSRKNTKPGKKLSADYNYLLNTWFMPIPQEVTAWNKTTSKSGAYIALLVRISKKEADGNLVQLFPKTEGKFAYVAVPISSSLLPGKAYMYYLTFMVEGAGYIAPDQTNPDIPNDIDPNPGPGGSKVLGGPITFTVSVDDWGSATEIHKNL